VTVVPFHPDFSALLFVSATFSYTTFTDLSQSVPIAPSSARLTMRSAHQRAALLLLNSAAVWPTPSTPPSLLHRQVPPPPIPPSSTSSTNVTPAATSSAASHHSTGSTFRVIIPVAVGASVLILLAVIIVRPSPIYLSFADGIHSSLRGVPSLNGGRSMFPAHRQVPLRLAIMAPVCPSHLALRRAELVPLGVIGASLLREEVGGMCAGQRVGTVSRRYPSIARRRAMRSSCSSGGSLPLVP
jgi:hypothetical protein